MKDQDTMYDKYMYNKMAALAASTAKSHNYQVIVNATAEDNNHKVRKGTLGFK